MGGAVRHWPSPAGRASLGSCRFGRPSEGVERLRPPELTTGQRTPRVPPHRLLRRLRSESFGAGFWGQVRGFRGEVQGPSRAGRNERINEVKCRETRSEAPFQYPTAPLLILHGKEGVDGSSPSEGLRKVPANRHFNVACVLNTRTHSGHICGTRDASRRLAAPSDTACGRASNSIAGERPANGLLPLSPWARP